MQGTTVCLVITVCLVMSPIFLVRSQERYHSCVITQEGAVKCWGSNSMGQLGDGTRDGRSTPVDVVGLRSGVVSIALGERHSCAVTSEGSLKCWGFAMLGQTGHSASGHDLSWLFTMIPGTVVGLSSGVVSVAAGRDHTCAVTSKRSLLCFGKNEYGQIGDGSKTNRATPRAVVGLSSGVVSVAAGREHTCAVLYGGEAKCWGMNQYGLLGINQSSFEHITPASVVGLIDGFKSMALGDAHSCAVTLLGAVQCWGYKYNPLPSTVVGLHTGIMSIAVSTYQCCVITNEGSLKCWKLESGNLNPSVVSGLTSGVKSVGLGKDHVCAVTSGGALTCWGYNQYGQLGDNTTLNRNSITSVVGLGNAAAKLWNDLCTDAFLVSFNISSRHRLAGKLNATAAISFIPFAKILSGSFITIFFPEFFFEPSVVPYFAQDSSSVASLSLSISLFSSNFMIFNISNGGIDASSPFCITMGGLTIGKKTAGSNNVSMSVEGCASSNFVASGAIHSKVFDTSLGIPLVDRVVGKPAVSVILFTSSAIMIPSDSNITLNYPSNFFAPSTPFVKVGAANVADLVVACSSTSSTSVVFTTSAAVIGTSPFVVTISGFTMGNSGANVTDGISITTSVHPDPSDGVESGILSCPPGSFWTGAPPACTLCPVGTYQSASDAWSCAPCAPGRFCDGTGLAVVAGMCPAGSYSPSGANTSSCTICSQGLYNDQLGQSSIAACLVCNRTGFATTKERDRCVTLQFAELPPSFVYSSDTQAFLPAVSLVDVDGNVARERSGVVSAVLHCSSPCDSELSATVPAYDLFPAFPISIVNGTSSRVPLLFTESSLGKIGVRYVWKFSSTQDNGPSSNSIPTLSALFPNASFMGAAPVYDVAPTIVASAGGTVLTVQGEWALPARLQPLFNSSAFCEFKYFSNSSGSSTTVRSAAFDASSANLKTCLSLPIPEFTSANLIIVFQDGRRRRVAAALSSVCHHGFYVDDGKCVRCPSSSLGRSTNTAINAPSVQACVCDVGSYGTYGTNCLFCNKPGFTTTKERDRCVTLQFAELPPSFVYSSDTQVFLPAVSLVDVDGNVVRERSGVVSAVLQCSSLCDSELSATVPAYDLFPAFPISIVNGTSSRVPLLFNEISVGKIGVRYVWKFSSTQDNGPSSNSIPTLSALFPNVSFMGAAPVHDVAPTIVASAGGTVLTVQGEWALPARLQPLFNSSAFCEFEYFNNASGSSATVKSNAFDASSANLKTCLSPPIPEFTSSNLTIVFQDGRRRRVAAALSSVCHHGFYVDDGKCVRCPSSSLGRSTNTAINAPSVQACVCDVGSYGTYGPNCRLCPKPASLNPPPFICNSTSIRYPIVVPGYWVDFSLLSNCVASVSAHCDAVKTCAFGDRACPGGGDKSCVQNEVECYEGVACTTCCTMFYLENEVCTKCPDSSETTVILAVVGTVCIVAAALTISSPSPSLMHSFKYFIIVINFLQRLFSLDLIRIEWPSSITNLFAWLKLFTLSVNIVRPECSFNWNFQTKVILTLLTPVCVSLLILCCGAVYGWFSCRSFWLQINRKPNSFSTKMNPSFRSLFQFWIDIVLYRNADLSCQNVTWAALYPLLMQRRRKRAALTASENWKCLRQKSQAVFKSALCPSRSQQMRHVLEHFETFESAQQSAPDEGFDLMFARIVTNGRKFMSTMFSVLVITFIGTLTSVLSVWNCKPRDGKMYLSEDANVECSLESSDYRRLFSVSMFGLIVYGVALPAFIFFIFRSKWCKEMVIYDFGAFESLFGFLTGRYASKYYMWEVVIFIQKTVSVLVPTYVTDAIQQSVFMTLATLLYLILVFIYSPFANDLLNFVEKLASLNIFLLYFSALLFVAEVDGVLVLEDTLKELLGLSLCVLCALSVAAAFSCAWYVAPYPSLHFCNILRRYEWVQLAVLHKVKVISNWMKCLRFAIGSSFSGDSAFALLFVLYNPVSRKDVANKQQQFNQKLANALLPLHQQYVGKSRFCLFGIKRAWIYFKFAIMHFDEDCSPVSVLAAVDEPHAAFVKHIARLNMLINKGAEKRGKKPSALLRKMQAFWSRRNKVSPEPIAQEVESDAPQQFIDELVSKRDFIAKNIDEDTRLTIITLLLFNHIADFGEDSAYQHYLGKLFDDGAACRAAMRSIFDASEELSQRAEVEDAAGGCMVSYWWRLHSWLLSSVFGQDMVKSINTFHRLDNGQQNELFKRHNFPLTDSINFSTTAADDIAQGKAEHTDTSEYAAGLKSLALVDSNVSSAQLYGEQLSADSTSLPIGPSSAVIEDDARQSNLSQNPQANSGRDRDLETELAELTASFATQLSKLNESNSKLKELLVISKNESDAFRAEILELQKSLAAAQPMQKPK